MKEKLLGAIASGALDPIVVIRAMCDYLGKIDLRILCDINKFFEKKEEQR